MATLRRGRSRRTMNEMNMVPFIDVMLVLLIIFMVTAPMATSGVINAPTVGTADQAPPAIAQVLVDASGHLQWEADGKTQSTTLADVGELASQWQAQQIAAGRKPADTAVVIVGDKQAAYESVMSAMSALQGHVSRVAFLVNKTN